MGTLQYEGATEGISERQLNFIGEILENRGLKNKKVRIDVVGAAGDNYIANVKRFTVFNNDGTEFQMIAKIAPNIEHYRAIASTAQSFQNEHVMYTKVLPKFKNMQIAAGVPKEYIFRFAECYGSNVEELHEVILLENLNVSNFIMLDRFKSLSNESMLSILKNLAIIHSLSFALKIKEPATFESFKHQLHDIWLSRNEIPEIRHVFEGLGDQIAALVSDSEQRTRVMREVFDGNHIISNLVEISKIDANSMNNVIQQGDTWTNNIMFKFDGDNLLESIFIDYQLSRIANPVNDLIFTIFSCTDYQARINHYYRWIDHYYTELGKALSYFDINANIVYPREQLNNDIKRYAKFMFSLCVISARLCTLNTEDAADLKENMKQNVEVIDISGKLMGVNDETIFKSRVEGLVDSFVEFGLLHQQDT